MEYYEKKYKDAMGMAEEIIRYYKEHNRGDENSIEDLEGIFPELKESEDEKIRKALIRFHKSTIDIDGIKGDRIVAWLEKQGESYTKKDVDDAYLKGISDAKHELEKQGEQNQEWSEEDENIAEDLIKGCVSAEYKSHHFLHTPKEVSDWLESLKDRMKGKEERHGKSCN